MKFSTVASIAILALSTGTALAQDTGKTGAASQAQSPSQSQSRDQANTKAATGTAQSQANAQGAAHASFATADTNKDGKLSVSELKIVMPGVMIKDEDSDGYVSQAEAEASIAGLSFTSGEDDDDIGATQYGEIVALMDKGGAAGAGAGANAGRGAGAAGAAPGGANRSSTNSAGGAGAGAGAGNRAGGADTDRNAAGGRD